MHIFVELFYSLLLIWMWYLLLRYRRVVKSWTGSFIWAEKYLWHGGTYLVLILLWCFFIFWWVLYPFWWLELIFWVSPDANPNIKMNN